jgi:hypothetical protein
MKLYTINLKNKIEQLILNYIYNFDSLIKKSRNIVRIKEGLFQV